MREVRACWPEHRRLRRVTGLKFRRPIGPGDALELELVRTPRRTRLRSSCAAAARSPARARFEFASDRVGPMTAAPRTCAVIPTFNNP